MLACLGIASAGRADIIGDSISVQFGVGGTDGGAPLAPSMVAGVVPSINWNVAVGDSGSLGGLVQDSRSVAIGTGASVSWNSNNTWTHPPSGFPAGSGDDILMSSYLDGETNGVPATATFSGLPAPAYDVYVYSADNNEAKESGGFFINGVHVLGSGGASTGGPTYIQTSPGVNGNYLLLQNVQATGGVISISDDASAFRIPMNGVELVAVPEPASVTSLVVGALGVGGVGFAGAWIRRRRKS
jgi:hypothetical protein